MPNILEQHMGDPFLKLAPLLQKVHTGKKHIEGTVCVKRGNWLAHIICTIFQFPKTDSNCKLSVDCTHTETLMLWQRQFNQLKMTSRFSTNGDFLIEHLGMLDLYFKAIENNTTLEYHFVKTTFFGIPMPSILSPKIVANESEKNGKYHFMVEVKMSLVGMVISYGGEMSLTLTQ